jgi:hypothetical protein
VAKLTASRVGIATAVVSAMVVVVLVLFATRGDYAELAPGSTASPSRHAGPPDPLHEAVRRLPWGNLAFAAPAQMKVGEPQIAELLLSPTATEGALAAALHARSLQATQRVRLSDRMTASLYGDGNVDISPAEQRILGVVRNGITRWRWTVKALRPGEHELLVTAWVLVDTDGQETPVAIKEFEHRLTVTVAEHPLWTLAKEQWAAFAGGLAAVGVAAAIGKTTKLFSRIWARVRGKS